MRKLPAAYGTMLSALTMILALLWLTVCPAFLDSPDVEANACSEQCHETPDPLNSTEEKSENNNTNQSEYLVDLTDLETPGHLLDRIYKLHCTELYFAFHPELISPPPEFSVF